MFFRLADHLIMRHEVPVTINGKSNPDFSANVFPINDPSAFKLDISCLAITLPVEDKIYPSVIDRQKCIKALFQSETDNRIAIDNLADLCAVASHDYELG
ncbi:hypothetical protein C3920_00160 [Novacetimonas pomaceti]|uniref:Uncharacterized protein n=1 Tax=Novacetimonas pomaceti TaxID=2021998 RepID=A0ABX5P677_9PROT|nr:hypothetical protein C3920_00160 [Novacetimonas pomaceti]